MRYLVLLPYALLFGTLSIVGCAQKLIGPVDTAPIAQGLSSIDASFQKIQKEKDRPTIQKIAQSGRKEVAATLLKLNEVQKTADEVTAQRDWWQAEDGKHVKEIHTKDIAIAKKDHKLNVLGLLLASAAAWLTFLLVGLLTPIITPAMLPYALVGRAACAAVVFAAVFSWVRYF